VGGFGGLDVERDLKRKVVKVIEDGFELLGRDQVLDLPSTDGD